MTVAMSITLEEIRKIAILARLQLTEAEEQRHAATISAVLEYMNILNEVDTTGIEPTFQVTGLTQITRPDVVEESPYRSALLAQFPESKNDQLVVPAVFE